MNTLTTRRNHLAAARFYALAADARRAALENGADREIAALHANQARRMRDRAAAARNGITEVKDVNLATHRNHMIAARLYSLAADARRAALKNGADQDLAAIQADQARRMRERAIAARNGAPYRTY